MVAHGDHQDKRERNQAEDLAEGEAAANGNAADGDTRGAAGKSGAALGESYRGHVRRGFPPRTNGRLRARGRRLTLRTRRDGRRNLLDLKNA
ncbi:hypothetical protein GCM10010344_33670 [Streptomyces bluensis]|nr:hypothetical protein GCM10010344_33670 [Streptomyces bluensis]